MTIAAKLFIYTATRRGQSFFLAVSQFALMVHLHSAIYSSGVCVFKSLKGKKQAVSSCFSLWIVSRN